MTTREKIDLIASTDPFELIDKVRRDTIEECAKVAENFGRGSLPQSMAIAAAIRALKDKP